MNNKTNITSSSYNTMFEDKNKSSGLTGAIVIIVLFSILSGLLGFYLGDTGKLKSLSFLNKNNSSANIYNPQATEYSSAQVQELLDEKAYDFKLYTQVIANLKDKYVDPEKVKDEALFEGSIKGMVDSIGDKATSYFNPKEYKEYKDSFSGQFEGIGVRLEYLNNAVTVVDVIPNSPASEVGVKTGFVFYKIDDKDVSTQSIDEIVVKVRGVAGSKVKITFIDPEKKEEVTKEITRAAIKVDSMRLIEKDKDTVVFEVSRFTESTVKEWTDKWDANVQQILNKGYKNVILDMRGNGGGFLDAAIYAANDFLVPNKLIVSEKSRVRSDKDTLSQRANPRLKDKKVVLLINGGTASASEILTGAVKFHNNYKVLGTKSYGKGTVQNPYEFSNGGMLKITTEYWILPTGKRLDTDNPILPDTEIKQDQDQLKQGKDNVMEEALKVIKQ